MIVELRDRARIAVLRELFGDEFNLERPVETLGGRLRRLIDLKEVDRFRQEQGEVRGLIRALEILDEKTREML